MKKIAHGNRVDRGNELVFLWLMLGRNGMAGICLCVNCLVVVYLVKYLLAVLRCLWFRPVSTV